ncbi:hypothetical protein EV05_1930 [Prochlorococcus sp. MIT 0601]|nr:hypothetical protein EV05_1930 [Prochlorococcus sp. MIT 0601]
MNSRELHLFKLEGRNFQKGLLDHMKREALWKEWERQSKLKV